eukprot:scaffold8945_cov129-Isochrysis_galbana.AAC.2
MNKCEVNDMHTRLSLCTPPRTTPSTDQPRHCQPPYAAGLFPCSSEPLPSLFAKNKRTLPSFLFGSPPLPLRRAFDGGDEYEGEGRVRPDPEPGSDHPFKQTRWALSLHNAARAVEWAAVKQPNAVVPERL